MSCLEARLVGAAGPFGGMDKSDETPETTGVEAARCREAPRRKEEAGDVVPAR
jgi:hypothetical protein